MKVLITGAGGQLGAALGRTSPAAVQVTGCTRAELDIVDAGAVMRRVQSLEPDLVINTAAFTGVDAAESDVDMATRVNVDGAANVARAAAAAGARIIHVSTDYVFDGSSSVPYAPGDRPAPLGVYGRTKLAGEERVREASGGDALILRTSWVYAAEGRNFFNAVITRMLAGSELRIVCDQVGSPTWATSLAGAIWALGAGHDTSGGIYHWTDAGVASWYDFGVAIMEESLAMGLLPAAVRIVPISTSDYPTAARRPAYSVLDKSATWARIGSPSPHWRDSLRSMLQEKASHAP